MRHTRHEPRAGQPRAAPRAGHAGDPLRALAGAIGNRATWRMLARAPGDNEPTRGGPGAAGPQMRTDAKGRVLLYRAIGPAERNALIRYGDFEWAPSGGGKYFSFTEPDARTAARALYGPDVTIVEVAVPKGFVPVKPDVREIVQQPHIPARGGPAVMIRGEVYMFYDPRAGGWSFHVDDDALMALNAQGTRPRIVDSQLQTVGRPPPVPLKPAPSGGSSSGAKPKLRPMRMKGILKGVGGTAMQVVFAIVLQKLMQRAAEAWVNQQIKAYQPKVEAAIKKEFAKGWDLYTAAPDKPLFARVRFDMVQAEDPVSSAGNSPLPGVAFEGVDFGREKVEGETKIEFKIEGGSYQVEHHHFAYSIPFSELIEADTDAEMFEHMAEYERQHPDAFGGPRPKLPGPGEPGFDSGLEWDRIRGEWKQKRKHH